MPDHASHIQNTVRAELLRAAPALPEEAALFIAPLYGGVPDAKLAEVTPETLNGPGRST